MPATSRPKRQPARRVRHDVIAELEQPLVAVDDDVARRVAKEDRRDAATIAAAETEWDASDASQRAVMGTRDAHVAEALVAAWRAEWAREDRKVARRAAKAEAERQAADTASVEAWAAHASEVVKAATAEPIELVATRILPREVERPIDWRLYDYDGEGD